MTRQGWCCLFILSVGLIAASAATAAPPWGALFTPSVDANANKDYKLSEANGPWMITACSFSGEGAQQQAHELAIELRKRYKLEAYVHKARFDLGEAPVRGVNRFGEKPRAKYLKSSARDNEIQEYAVMVGNYQTVDDPEAQRVMQKLKFARPQCLEVGDRKATNQSLASWRIVQRQVQDAMGKENKNRGPMGHAFVTTNPLLPPDFFNTPGVDQFVLHMNRDVKYSLLNCPGKYTVKVAEFTGEIIIDQKKIREAEQRESDGDKLAEAGEKAEKLTEALRQLHYEAYCLHDRYASIVCIGAFDSVGTPRPDGKIEINPQIHRIIEFFRAQPANIPGQPSAMKAKELIGIAFDWQPVPVQVPKTSIGANYSRSMLSSQ